MNFHAIFRASTAIRRSRATPSLVLRASLVASITLAAALHPAAAQPADPPPPARDGLSGSGLARRPNPKLADRSASGASLRPFSNHRKLGAVYHTVEVNALSLTAPIAGLQSSPTDLAGYLVARIPMDAASNGALGPVIVAGQWQIPWSAILDGPTLARWSSSQGGPLKLEEFPAVALTVRNAMETRLLSKDGASSSYMCTIVADVSINGITTERLIQRALITFMRDTAADPSVKGEQVSLRARFQVRLSDFFSSLPGLNSPPTIDVNADLLMSTVSPDVQKDDTDSTPMPQESVPASSESESPKPSGPSPAVPSPAVPSAPK